MKRDRNIIEEVYDDLCLKGKYDEKYAWKQRVGNFESGDRETSYKGGSLNICEYLSRRMRNYGFETHIVFTRKYNKYKFLHAAVLYGYRGEYYIADPTSDLKIFAERGLNDIFLNSAYISNAEQERKKLLKQSENKKRDIDEYIKEFGPITLSNILLENEVKYLKNSKEVLNAIERISKSHKEGDYYDHYTGRWFDKKGFYKDKLHRNGTYYDDEGYDYRGINRKGFNREGIHYKTNKPYDEIGRKENGKFYYDEEGYTILGFDKSYKHKNGTTRDDEGYDYKGINKKGFNREGKHYKTDAPYDENGYKENGEYYYDEEGYDYLGFNELGRDREGYDKKGFDEYKLHRNGTYYDNEGYKYDGFDKRGFNREGIHYKTGKLYDENGKKKDGKYYYDEEGYNIFGFNKFQRHRNGTYYDDEGYNCSGINKKGFNRESIHYKTGKLYDENGYKENGEYYYDEEGYDYLGFNELGRDREGYDKKGFDENKIHRNGTKFDEKGRDIEGYNEEGYNEQGIDREGYNQEGYNKYEVNREGINKKTGEKDSRILLVEDFINSDTSRQNFCKQRNINSEEFNILLREIFDMYPRIGITKEKISKIAQKSSAIYLAKRERIVNKLINGELSIEEYCNNNAGIKFEDLLQEVKGTDKEIKLYKIFGEAFTTKKFDMMDYIKIFEKGKYDSEVYRRTMQKFVNFERECLKHKELLEVYKKLKEEERRLGKYKAPFNKSEIQKIGYVNKETGSIEFIEITDEHIEYARQYLIANGKYICSSNMQEVFSKFAKKELSFEDVENLKTKPEHNSQEIAEGITLRDGEIEDILNETLAEQNKEQEKIGQTQGDT